MAGGVSRAQRHDYLKEPEVEEKDGMVTVRVNTPRPLEQALCAIAKRHDWLIDYEDPEYFSGFDFVDATNPEWRAAHPDSPVKAMIPSGGAFEFNYDERLVRFAGGERQILNALLEAYNASENPGRFGLRDLQIEFNPWKSGRDRFAIVGVAVKDHQGSLQTVTPILDTLITLPTEERSASETIRLIGEELFAKRQVKVFEGGFANNRTLQTKVTVGGTETSARSLLVQTLRQVGEPYMTWDARYDRSTPLYSLNVGVRRSCN